MASTDPLLLLRAALSASGTITLLSIPTPDSPPTEVFELPHATHISFSSRLNPFPKKTTTRYTSQQDAAVGYDLETLLFAFLLKEDSTVDYMKKTREAGSNFVSITERKTVVDWLSGKSSIEGPDGRIKPLEGDAASNKRPLEETASAEALTTTTATTTEATTSSTALPVTPGQNKRPRYIPDKADQEKVKQLIDIMDGPTSSFELGAMKNKDSVLRGDRLNNFDSVRHALTSRIRILKEETPSSNPINTPASSKSSTGTSGSGKKRRDHPIIIISPSSTALITMHNVKRFLEDSVFEHTSDILSRQASSGLTTRQNEDMVPIYHAKTLSSQSDLGTAQKKKMFYVVEGVENLTKLTGGNGWDEAWERVVCVMTTGQEWQFRPYKWREPKELFHHVKGIHFQWTTDAPNPKVRSWNVSELRIDPNKRHIDKSVVTDFWRTLENWMQINRPGLLA